MTRSGIRAFILLAGFASLTAAQIKVNRTEQLHLDRSHAWSRPQFSPSGRSIYFTDLGGDGIWEYSLRSGSSRQITADPKSGFAYSVSPDGASLIYRRTTYEESGRTRKQDIVMMNLTEGSSSIIASGPDVSIPIFSNSAPVYSIHSKTVGLARTSGVTDVAVLGIEDAKIAVSVNGIKTLLDPLGNGSYIWPVLSPDRQRLAAYEMDRGAFICDLRGTVTSRLGRRDAPSWTRSGRWIVYMEDKDDGHQLLSSDLFAVAPDGRTVVQLTSTPGVLEMYPRCSPTENKIVCSTPDGAIILLEYVEGE
jgi:Tol biopolymer transport system component